MKSYQIMPLINIITECYSKGFYIIMDELVFFLGLLPCIFLLPISWIVRKIIFKNYTQEEMNKKLSARIFVIIMVIL